MWKRQQGKKKLVLGNYDSHTHAVLHWCCLHATLDNSSPFLTNGNTWWTYIAVLIWHMIIVVSDIHCRWSLCTVESIQILGRLELTILRPFTAEQWDKLYCNHSRCPILSVLFEVHVVTSTCIILMYALPYQLSACFSLVFSPCVYKSLIHVPVRTE